MSSQYENPVYDASAQTRQTGGILTPLSDNSLNLSDEGLHGGRKRKRDGSTMEDLLKDPFVVKVSNLFSSQSGIMLTLAYSHTHQPFMRSLERSTHLSYYLDPTYLYPHLIFFVQQVLFLSLDFSRLMSKYLNWKSEWEISQWYL